MMEHEDLNEAKVLILFAQIKAEHEHELCQKALMRTLECVSGLCTFFKHFHLTYFGFPKGLSF